ncbi:hypothetical protein KAJ83_04200 [Marivibrio halodurans]|uniref:Uncharacterized protein n=1 Tax=Marivibrio halodurans TaxID=2039722 RepID=A0A8J7S022_9PROT|nr:hypothetical protein [Marivibrio halodurans]MBP5856198.1 hypothetical protein [Marivibrio halodurans]
MNPMQDTTLTIAQIADGRIDHRRDQLSAQTLRERVELSRAVERERARQRRTVIYAGLGRMLRTLLARFPRGLRPAPRPVSGPATTPSGGCAA